MKKKLENIKESALLKGLVMLIGNKSRKSVKDKTNQEFLKKGGHSLKKISKKRYFF